MRSWMLPTAVFLSFGAGLAQEATPAPAKNYLNLSLDGLLAAGASTDP